MTQLAMRFMGPPRVECDGIPIEVDTRNQEVAPVATPQVAQTEPQVALVGRASEWATLLASYGSIGPNGQVIVVKGEAGIGKTRLAEAFLAHVSSTGATTITARCYEGETHLAYAPFMEALHAALSLPGQTALCAKIPDGSLVEAARLVPELVGMRSGLPAPDGDVDQALSLAETALALCIARVDRHREAALHNNLADMLHAAGRSEAAMAHLKQAVAIYAEIGVEAGAIQPQIWRLAE